MARRFTPHQLVLRGSPNFTRLSRTTGHTNLLDMTSLFAPVGCNMQINAALHSPKYSPNFTPLPCRPSMELREYERASDTGLHFMEFRGKRIRMPHPTALGRMLVARHFACPTNWWVYCYHKHGNFPDPFKWTYAQHWHFTLYSVRLQYIMQGPW